LKYLIIVLIINLVFPQVSDSQTFNLKDGTVINGTIIEENNETYTIQTKYGSVIVNKNELLEKLYEVILKSGETFSGLRISETSTSIQLKTNVGILNIEKSDILDMKETGQVSPTESKNSSQPSEVDLYFMNKKKSSSPLDFLFGGSKLSKDEDFAIGEEQLTDLFFDATGYTMAQSTLYLSGLSFGFGLTDKLQITTKWGGFLWGDLNLRPKIQIFGSGNWEKQHSLSLGAHYHTRWFPNRHEWKSDSVEVTNFTGKRHFGEDCEAEGLNSYDCWEQTAAAEKVTKYWGRYYKIGAEEDTTIKYDKPDNYDENAVGAYFDYEPSEEDDFWDEDGWFDKDGVEMIELFGAYTYSKARSSLKGRISHTLGGNIQLFPSNDDLPLLYRVYYGLDVDINSKIKVISEIFYDPFFLELWQELEYGDTWSTEDLSDDPISKPDDYRPIHLDFGFIYAINETFRFGLHFQKPFIAFYWKF